MEVNKFVTMTVGLIVAVLLVSGLMVPVIASVSSDDGGVDREEYTNTGEVYFKPVGNETTTFTLGSYIDDYDMTYTTLSINDGEPITIGPEWVSENDFESLFYPLLTFTYEGKKGIEGIIFNADFGNLDTEDVRKGGCGYIRYIEGSDNLSYICLTNGTISDPQTILIENGTVSYDFEMWDSEEIPQINARYDLVFTDSSDGATHVMTDNATVYSDTPIFYSGYFGAVSIETDEDSGDPAVFDTSLFAVSIGNVDTINPLTFWTGPEFAYDVQELNALITDNDGAYTLSDVLFEDDNYLSGGYIVPITVGGSNGSGLSPTLTTLLSVIPLITVVGLIIGTISYLRFKE